MLGFLGKLLDSNEKQINKLKPTIAAINDRERQMRALKKKDFSARTDKLREQAAAGTALDDLLVESYALVREAARRVLGERPYDVQLLSGLVLHQGKVAEQKTGEGKTLSASLPMYLNALSGRDVHLVTVNDYLARVGAGWMGPVYHLLGMKVSAIIQNASFLYDPEHHNADAADWRLQPLRPISRREAYEADITYGINSEFGFDYLRDNMVSDIKQKSQRGHHYAIVDEVDSVLIDEARTPHIISAPDTAPTDKIYEYAQMVRTLDKSDYEIDEKLRTVHLSERGIAKIEKMLGVDNLYERDFSVIHRIEGALKAKTLFHHDKEYVVRDNEVIIVDEFTGRLLPGRRFSEGLHQAIEAKEGVAIQRESKTLATVSLQNYFRKYEKLAGMTGTAATEAEEFHKIYDLDVVIVPTNKPIIRRDHPDVVYKTTHAKYEAVAAEVGEYQKRGQPVLVGTTSIEHNELLSQTLRRHKVPHEVLNAKNHQREALIIANAGKKGAVTVATNMAGRGVDIILGGAQPNRYLVDTDKKQFEKEKTAWQKAHDEVLALGGLHVVGTERHESRRIDNQLRGRSGRQGDPGSTRFFVSLEDNLMRIFGGEQVARIMNTFKLPDNVPLEHGMVSKAIEQAQVKVEGFHFDSRKHLVEYDDVLNKQREIVYGRRDEILHSDNLRDDVLTKLSDQVHHIVAMHTSEKGDIDREAVLAEFVTIVPFDENSRKQVLKQLRQQHDAEELTEFLQELVMDIYQKREQEIGADVMRQLERWVSLSVIDTVWMDHLTAIDDLRQGIGLRGYAQRDPLVEYKNEAFSMFEQLLAQVDYQITRRVFKIHVHRAPEAVAQIKQEQSQIAAAATAASPAAKKQNAPQPAQKAETKPSRNDPCPCGSVNPKSGKPYKYKKCGLINAPHHQG